MSRFLLKFFIITAIMLAGVVWVNGQNTLPDELTKGTINEQLKYLDEHTRIYENYRAIREDMFRSISRNTIDTLTKAKTRINALALQTATLNHRIDSLNKSMEASGNRLLEATRTKDSIRVLGMEVNKTFYNTLMWTILAVLLFLLIAGYLSFMRNRVITLRTKKDLEDLKEEYEGYRQKVRVEREKTNLEHFNEIRKLKGGLPK
jgi:ABC-type sugar transport system permease subunit